MILGLIQRSRATQVARVIPEPVLKATPVLKETLAYRAIRGLELKVILESEILEFRVIRALACKEIPELEIREYKAIPEAEPRAILVLEIPALRATQAAATQA